VDKQSEGTIDYLIVGGGWYNYYLALPAYLRGVSAGKKVTKILGFY